MIYVHVPFCRSFCTYCDFYSEVAAKCRKAEEEQRQNELFNSFSKAVAKEVRMRGNEICDQVNTLYIGGGTPSVLPLYVFEELLGALEETGHGGPFDEFTVEVNPEDIVEKGKGYVEGLLRLGVNRISMGVQSFDDGILKFMNRRHDAATARKAYAILEEAGVGNISIDLIFGLSQMSDAQWNESLKNALGLSASGRLPKHISAYQLSVEPGSMLARMVEKGMWNEAPEDLCARQYAMLCKALAEAGYNHYEISNFALPGYEAMHNSAYWSHVPYVGFGPGAHSFGSKRSRQWNRPDLRAYIADPCGISEHEELNDDQLELERIMLALRTSEGIEETFLRNHCDPHALERAFASGDLAIMSGGRVRIPENRFFVSDAVIADIV